MVVRQLDGFSLSVRFVALSPLRGIIWKSNNKLLQHQPFVYLLWLAWVRSQQQLAEAEKQLGECEAQFQVFGGRSLDAMGADQVKPDGAATATLLHTQLDHLTRLSVCEQLLGFGTILTISTACHSEDKADQV